MMTATATQPLDARTLRDDFPILSQKVHGGKPLVYLDNAATTQRPRPVIATVVDGYERKYANVHRGIHYLSELSTDAYEAARETVQRFINAERSREVVFTNGATASINLVARSWGDANLKAGDEILLTEMEHHSNIVPWQQLAARSGATVRFVPITNDGQLRMDQLDRLLTERVKIFAFTAVSNVLGTVNDVAGIVRRAKSSGAVTVVDAAQSVPHEPTDVQAWDADFVAFSGHKMMAPSGIGVLYGRERLLEEMPPFLGGGSMIHRVTKDGFTPADLPEKFEAGTPPIVPAFGMTAAIEYLDKVGLPAIANHEQMLTNKTHELLEPIDGIRLLGPAPSEKAGIVSFAFEDIQADDIATTLDAQGVAVRAGHHCAMPLHDRLGISASVRASFYLYNTVEDVEAFGEALQSALRLFRDR